MQKWKISTVQISHFNKNFTPFISWPWVRKGGLTVFVAENGNGKTAILEALRYLLAPFIARFSRLPVPRIKDSDYRDEWSTVGAREGEIFRRLPRAPFMRIGATARFADTDSVRWDVVVKRDKTVKLSDSPVSFEGTRALNQEADNLIIADIQDTPKVLPVFAY
ncbi:MAG: AAA family ATPase, partial [Thermoguttaceae bacterium]|nr:AAA family ATPase [Thermoguttaceae bacterium]